MSDNNNRNPNQQKDLNRPQGGSQQGNRPQNPQQQDRNKNRQDQGGQGGYNKGKW